MKGSSRDLPLGRELCPVLSPSVGGLGTSGNRSEGLEVVRGPGVVSVSWGFVDPGWGTRAKFGFTVSVRGSEVQTASLLALPGRAIDLQLVGEETWSGATEDSGWLRVAGLTRGRQVGGQGSPQPG